METTPLLNFPTDLEFSLAVHFDVISKQTASYLLRCYQECFYPENPHGLPFIARLLI
jgi:hypothetical protein